jgi:CRISPR-associated protein Csx17
MTHEIELKGCSPTPLAHYLKALGILRLVAEQKDPNAKGCWRDEAFVLQSSLDKENLLRFFLEEYRPTPITAPWNAGSGFYFEEGKAATIDPETGKSLKTGKKLKTGIRDKDTEATRTLDKLLQSQCDRFKGYKVLLGKTRQILDEKGLEEAPKENQKSLLIQIVRNTYPDEFLKWLDAVLLIGSDKVSYPPLLGTGGNDGRLDFTNNYMQRLLRLFDAFTGEPNSFVTNWLEDSLFLQPTPQMLKEAAIGQFLPGNAGSPNGISGFESKSLVNPWDFVLMLEGGLFFATNTVRRLSSNSAGALSFPFTVRMTGLEVVRVIRKTKLTRVVKFGCRSGAELHLLMKLAAYFKRDEQPLTSVSPKTD